jgi:glycosyltransferase involved in cell wall biosynthesis
MRIALTVDPELPVPPYQYGGIERIVDMLARGLAMRGHDVTLFAHHDSQCPVRKVAWKGRSSDSRLNTLQNMATLTRSVISGKYDLIHSVSRLAYLGPLLPASIPKLMSYHREIASSTTSRAFQLSRGTLEFTALTESMLSGRRLRGRWHVVPNGVSLDAYDYTPEVTGDGPLVFLGRIEEIKGPHLAIEVAQLTGADLVIAGNVPDEHRGWFQEFIAPHLDGTQIRYIGPVDDMQKNALLGRARALLMPILWEEPFGMVMIEAMACGTPVLAFNRGSAKEVVDHGRTGFVVNDLKEMVSRVREIGILSRASCRERVERLYSADAVTEAYLAIYKHLSRASG